MASSTPRSMQAGSADKPASSDISASPAKSTAAATPSASLLPSWAVEVKANYESAAANQFLLHGNVDDRVLLPAARDEPARLGDLDDFLLSRLLPGFDIVLSYDLGNGLRVERGGSILAEWSAYKEARDLPRQPRPSIELLTRFFRYNANVGRLGREPVQIAVILRAAQLITPAVPGALNYDLNAIALLLRGWSIEDALVESPLATFLVAENLNDLHPLLVTNSRAVAVELPMPAPADLSRAVGLLAPDHATALGEFADRLDDFSGQLTGASLGSVESLIKRHEHRGEAIAPAELVRLKKSLVEQDANGLIEFIESRRTLDNVHAQDRLKEWLRQDIALWKQGELEAMPMGYLLCGPVGTGKTYLVECLAGEAGIPVVKIKNFRDRWVGSTEGNLEKIFRLLHALGRCFVFIDEADQALGKRESGGNDSGLSGRVYAMFAKEMSDSANRGRIVWVLASSRPDLIEVDLKRPGRVDVKIPIFPTTEPEAGLDLLRALCRRRDITFTDGEAEQLLGSIPDLLTPGAAEALSVKIFRTVRVQGLDPLAAALDSLRDYQPPVAPDVLEFQMRLAVNETTDMDFVPERLRNLLLPQK